jgi:predicted aminopeptidase
MVFLKKLIKYGPILFLFYFSSCAKIHYLAEQGIGQVSLLTKAKDNSSVLKDVKVDKKHKEKIKKINKYKNYFYKYWNRKPTAIYSKTTFLETKAVTYLVIASPYSEIKAKKECFPFMGCFPYLGFYHKSSADSHAKDLEEQDYVTYIRPVYAYSTLGYFTDTILSSFFYYNDYDLSELIFHELFHTIFFIKDEVDLNENLANYFGKEMAMEYFNFNEAKKEKMLKEKEDSESISLLIVKLANRLNRKYKKLNPKTKKEAQRIFVEWKESVFDLEIDKHCANNQISKENCYPKKRKWNNASLAAFLTYEKSAKKIALLQKKLNLSLKEFYFHIEKMYNSFKETDKKNFSAHLFRPLDNK